MNWVSTKDRYPKLVLVPTLEGSPARMPQSGVWHLCLVKTDTPGEYSPMLLYPHWGVRARIAAGLDKDEEWAGKLLTRKSSYLFLGWVDDAVDVRAIGDIIRVAPQDVAYWTEITLPEESES